MILSVGIELVGLLVSIVRLGQRRRAVKAGKTLTKSWDDFLLHQVGPNRDAPLHGFRPANPAERRRKDRNGPN